jgi:L-ascorbate metabolism protein UlaG (beta-lactamase superfamily)
MNRSHDCFFCFDPITSYQRKAKNDVIVPMKRFRELRILRIILGAAVFINALVSFTPSAYSSCRDPEVARGFGSVAYAANVDATIQYFGHNFFLITTSKGTRIVTDPLGPGWYPNPNVVGDVVTVGKEQFNHNAVQIVLGNPVILRGLKNYGAGWNTISTSVKDAFIYNVPIHQNAEFIQGIHGSAFVFDLGTLCIAHLGDLSQKLNDQQIKAFGKVDVALTPIGGRRTMDPELAREVLAQLKPKIAIPMHHRDSPSLVQQFSAGMRMQVLPGDTLTVSKSALPQATEIKVLQPRGAMDYK